MKFIYKFLINWYQASDKPLPNWLRRACSKDETLAREVASGESLSRSLREQAGRAPAFDRTNVADRVMRQIAREEQVDERKRDRGIASWTPFFGMAVAACAVALVSVQFWPSAQPDEDQVAPALEVVRVDVPLDGPSVDLDVDLNEIGKSWTNPLDQEIENVISDAKGALGFLASNFVPSSYLKAEGSGAKQTRG